MDSKNMSRLVHIELLSSNRRLWKQLVMCLVNGGYNANTYTPIWSHMSTTTITQKQFRQINITHYFVRIRVSDTNNTTGVNIITRNSRWKYTKCVSPPNRERLTSDQVVVFLSKPRGRSPTGYKNSPLDRLPHFLFSLRPLSSSVSTVFLLLLVLVSKILEKNGKSYQGCSDKKYFDWWLVFDSP